MSIVHCALYLHIIIVRGCDQLSTERGILLSLCGRPKAAIAAFCQPVRPPVRPSLTGS